MALLNFITQGTYSTIDDIQYVRKNQYLRLHLDVYSDSTKQIHLCSKVFDINGLVTIPGVSSLNQNQIPQNPKEEDSYIVGSEAEGEWSNHKKLIAKWMSIPRIDQEPILGWTYWSFNVGQTVYNEEDGKYYIYKENRLEPFTCLHDSRVWTNNFTPALIAENGLHSQIYSFLKTLPGFENAIDG